MDFQTMNASLANTVQTVAARCELTDEHLQQFLQSGLPESILQQEDYFTVVQQSLTNLHTQQGADTHQGIIWWSLSKTLQQNLQKL